ncbi:MAG: radical SAM protein [Tannerella sp.]|nr:radical SAM protein [Tannerella sp.]
MATILFDKIIYGPVHSRRLGLSLGINLSPADGKRCTFDCIYCECGLNAERKTHSAAPSREDVSKALINSLEQGVKPDVITFSGNGEPTMHPHFAEIIDDVISIRNTRCKHAKIAVISNSTMLHKPLIISALCKVDDNLMKFDAGSDKLMRLIDSPLSNDFTVEQLITDLCRFDGRLTVQTMFLHGEHNGVSVDNTGDADVEQYIAALHRIRPYKVMLYTINRETPVKTIYKTSAETLNAIAAKVSAAGFEVVVSG